jgi:DNA-binding transcriptional LysR family regulator
MNITALDLNLLLVFEALLDERNVTRAAKRLALSQPATSNALARLRGVIGDPLFTRNQRGLQPTPRAEQLAAGVRLGLAQIRSALGGTTKFDAVTSTRAFRIAMTDSAEWLLLPGLSHRLTNSARGVRLQIRRVDGLFVIPEADLRAGACDLAIGYFPDSRTLSDGMQSEDLFEEEQRVVFRRGHPALRRALTLECFAALDQASVIYRAEPWGLIDTELAAHGLRRKLRLAAPHFHTVLASVASSDLAAMVPERIARLGSRLFGLGSRPSPLRVPRFVTRMVWRRADQEDDAHCWLREMVRAASVEKARRR